MTSERSGVRTDGASYHAAGGSRAEIASASAAPWLSVTPLGAPGHGARPVRDDLREGHGEATENKAAARWAAP